MHAGLDAHVGDAAVAQQVVEHRHRVADALERQQRAAKALGVARRERRRQAEPQLAVAVVEACALIIAVGSPKLARSRRNALLTKSCADTSRCASLPASSAAAAPPPRAGARAPSRLRASARVSALRAASPTRRARRHRTGARRAPSTRCPPGTAGAPTRRRARRQAPERAPAVHRRRHRAASARRPHAAAAVRRCRSPRRPRRRSTARSSRLPPTAPCSRSVAASAATSSSVPGNRGDIAASSQPATITSGIANSETAMPPPSPDWRARLRRAHHLGQPAPQVPVDGGRIGAVEQRLQRGVRCGQRRRNVAVDVVVGGGRGLGLVAAEARVDAVGGRQRSRIRARPRSRVRT